MMTSLSGIRGIGKTYFLSKELFKRRKANWLCISNFKHLQANYILDQSKEQLVEMINEIGRLKELGYELCDLSSTFTHTGVFFAIDEAHLYFGAEDWKRYASNPKFKFVIAFLSQARKQDVEVFYSAQDPSKIDKNWRRYTEYWIRYRAVVPWRTKVLVPHPTRPIKRAEIRYRFPLMWEESHDLDYEDPVFDYSMRKDEKGYWHISKTNTIISRRLIMSGWMDPFPYKLYDSYQTIAMEGTQGASEYQKGIDAFPLLKDLSLIPDTMGREKFPTFKKLLGIKRNDEKIPTRMHVPVELPPFEEIKPQMQRITQPEEFIKDIKEFLREKDTPRERKNRSGAIENRNQMSFKEWEETHIDLPL